ncbi:MAG: DUF1326 domain-containing protein [Solirubrobacterales bacterium]|nr:DUF1326 domain-containing protein [Solirubrobacterales bacterium]
MPFRCQLWCEALADRFLGTGGHRVEDLPFAGHPCRRVDGVSGGRSTHGVCMGVLSWLIDEGAVDGTDLSGLPVALACRYSDDEPGSPWTWALYLDARASEEQRAALRRIFTGDLGGDAQRHFPWAWKPSELVAVRP